MKKGALPLIIGMALVAIALVLSYYNGFFSYLSYGLSVFFTIADRQYGILIELLGLVGIISILIGAEQNLRSIKEGPPDES